MHQCHCKTSSCQSSSLIMNAYIYNQSTFLIDKLIILSESRRKALLITSSRRRFNQIFILATEFIIDKPRHKAIEAYLLLLYYIVMSNLEVNISPIESRFHYIQLVAHLALISFKQVCGLQEVGCIFNPKPLPLSCYVIGLPVGSQKRRDAFLTPSHCYDPNWRLIHR